LIKEKCNGNCKESTGQEGRSEEARREEGTGEEGRCEEGAGEEGRCEEGASEEGCCEEGASEEGCCEEGSCEKGSCQEGSEEAGGQEACPRASQGRTGRTGEDRAEPAGRMAVPDGQQTLILRAQDSHNPAQAGFFVFGRRCAP
jgi:hypothetical protein